MAESHGVYSEKPNAFWMLFGAKTRKWLQKYQSTTGFIRYFEQLFSKLQNVVLLTVFDVLQYRKTASSFSGKPNAF